MDQDECCMARNEPKGKTVSHSEGTGCSHHKTSYSREKGWAQRRSEFHGTYDRWHYKRYSRPKRGNDRARQKWRAKRLAHPVGSATASGAFHSPSSQKNRLKGYALPPKFCTQGITTVRDGAVSKDEMLTLLQGPWEQGKLPIRVRPDDFFIRGTVAEQIAAIDGWGVSSGFGDDFLRIWGLKVVMDGGAEAAALLQPYANKPGYKGFLFWKPEGSDSGRQPCSQTRVEYRHPLRGDLAVKTILDVYQRVIQDNPVCPARYARHGTRIPR